MSEAKEKKGFKGLVDKTKVFFHELKIEFKKIIWPTREQLTKNTLIVLAAVAVFGVAVAVLDFTFIYAMSILIPSVG